MIDRKAFLEISREFSALEKATTFKSMVASLLGVDAALLANMDLRDARLISSCAVCGHWFVQHAVKYSLCTFMVMIRVPTVADCS